VKELVQPVDNPQVANAETHSNKRFTKLIVGSKIEIANTEIKITRADINIIEYDLSTNSNSGTPLVLTQLVV